MDPVRDAVAAMTAALGERYEIERELGRGGTATVYVAQDRRHGREVAVKVLRPDVAAAIGAERFLREITIAARLTHSNVLPLIDSGQAAGSLYYVMPYVRGKRYGSAWCASHGFPSRTRSPSHGSWARGSTTHTARGSCTG